MATCEQMNLADLQRPVDWLNASCHCVRLDQQRLYDHWRSEGSATATAFADRPGLAADGVVFLDAVDAALMDRVTALVHRALSHPTYIRHMEAAAPDIARLPQACSGGLLGLDFHLGGPTPQLIEINTNPGGFLINIELAGMLHGCCADADDWLDAGLPALDELPARLLAHHHRDWVAMRGQAPLQSVAIVDDNATAQFLYPEFLLYQRLFERAGLACRIFDAASLEYRDGKLVAGGIAIDLVINRVTDFYLAQPQHAALRQAYLEGATVITPHPRAHAQWADKRLLVWLRDDDMLREAGLDADDREHLKSCIPRTALVDAANAQQWWQNRKQWFFKPIDGHGGKAAYRGEKLTRGTFEQILQRPYVAQAVVPTSMRSVVIDGQAADLRVDVRNFACEGSTWLRAARLYRGQTTNFRTPGGGFAPVIVAHA